MIAASAPIQCLLYHSDACDGLLLNLFSGLRHASIDYNNDGVITGTSEAYGDFSCPMGNDMNFKRFHAVNRHYLGWLGKSGAVSVNPVDTTVIVSSSQDMGGINDNVALVQLTGPDASGTTLPYWISLRTSLSYRDIGLMDVPDDAQGEWYDVVYVHRAEGTKGQPTRLVAKLHAEEGRNVFEDAAHGVHINVLEINTQTTMATVNFPLVCHIGPGGFPPTSRPIAAVPNRIQDCRVSESVAVTLFITNDDYGRLGDHTPCMAGNRYRVLPALETLPPSHPEWSVCSTIEVDSVILPLGVAISWEVSGCCSALPALLPSYCQQ